jgi:ribose 5-phosphate isomerase A
VTQDAAKAAAAAAVVPMIQPGMVVGLGTGSTAAHFVRLLGEAVGRGLSITAVPTSNTTAAMARAAGIALIEPGADTRIDVCVDGADEIDPALRLIKGGGAALLREKIVGHAAKRLIVIADETKLVAQLGKFPLPVEIAPFCPALTIAEVKSAMTAAGCPGSDARLRGAPLPTRTEGGNFILDCACQDIPNPEELAKRLSAIPGVMEHGLFIGLTSEVVVSGAGGVRTLKPAAGAAG